MRKAYIYYDDIFCGILEEKDEYVFTYDSNYNGKAISLTMPTTCKIYKSKVLHPFFDGLIPEGYLLEVGAKMYNISILDRMGLLLALCKDVIGAVSVVEANDEMPMF